MEIGISHLCDCKSVQCSCLLLLYCVFSNTFGIFHFLSTHSIVVRLFRRMLYPNWRKRGYNYHFSIELFLRLKQPKFEFCQYLEEKEIVLHDIRETQKCTEVEWKLLTSGKLKGKLECVTILLSFLEINVSKQVLLNFRFWVSLHDITHIMLHFVNLDAWE